MSSHPSPRSREVPLGTVPRQAAVLIFLYQKAGEWHFPLILRPDYDGVHSGQMAFPGGRWEQQDADLAETALRETQEEIGVQVERAALAGKLSELYIPPSNNLVNPFLAIGHTAPKKFIPDPKEVAKVLEVPVNQLKNPEIIQKTRFTFQNGVSFTAPSFVIDGHTIWGATAMILSEMLEILDECDF